MPVSRILVPQPAPPRVSVPVYPVRVVGGPTGATGPTGAGGITATVTTAKVTSGGMTGSMTFTAGLLTAQTPAT